jgi:hypothetical protein
MTKETLCFACGKQLLTKPAVFKGEPHCDECHGAFTRPSNLARTVEPVPEVKIHPDDATIGAMAMNAWARLIAPHVKAHDAPIEAEAVKTALGFIAEARRQRLKAEKYARENKT